MKALKRSLFRLFVWILLVGSVFFFVACNGESVPPLAETKNSLTVTEEDAPSQEQGATDSQGEDGAQDSTQGEENGATQDAPAQDSEGGSLEPQPENGAEQATDQNAAQEDENGSTGQIGGQEGGSVTPTETQEGNNEQVVDPSTNAGQSGGNETQTSEPTPDEQAGEGQGETDVSTEPTEPSQEGGSSSEGNEQGENAGQIDPTEPWEDPVDYSRFFDLTETKDGRYRRIAFEEESNALLTLYSEGTYLIGKAKIKGGEITLYLGEDLKEIRGTLWGDWNDAGVISDYVYLEELSAFKPIRIRFAFKTAQLFLAEEEIDLLTESPEEEKETIPADPAEEGGQGDPSANPNESQTEPDGTAAQEQDGNKPEGDGQTPDPTQNEGEQGTSSGHDSEPTDSELTEPEQGQSEPSQGAQEGEQGDSGEHPSEQTGEMGDPFESSNEPDPTENEPAQTEPGETNAEQTGEQTNDPEQTGNESSDPAGEQEPVSPIEEPQEDPDEEENGAANDPEIDPEPLAPRCEECGALLASDSAHLATCSHYDDIPAGSKVFDLLNRIEGMREKDERLRRIVRADGEEYFLVFNYLSEDSYEDFVLWAARNGSSYSEDKEDGVFHILCEAGGLEFRVECNVVKGDTYKIVVRVIGTEP